jgi:ribosomal protein L4
MWLRQMAQFSTWMSANTRRRGQVHGSSTRRPPQRSGPARHPGLDSSSCRSGGSSGSCWPPDDHVHNVDAAPSVPQDRVDHVKS